MRDRTGALPTTDSGLPIRTPGATCAGDSDPDMNEALRRVRRIGPRPAPPQQRLTAVPLPREIVTDLDILLANPVVPIDADGWAHYGQSDDDSPAIPKIPGPRKPSDANQAHQHLAA